MRRLALFLVALCFAADAYASDIDTARAARKRGDIDTYVRIVTRLAEQGDDLAEVLLGDVYSKGEDRPQDFAKALRWYGTPKKVRHAYYLGRIGLILREGGKGITPNPTKAYAYLHEAALRGDGSMSWIWQALSKMYFDGTGIRKNRAAAFMWLEKLAHHANDPAAQRNLGMLYGQGTGNVRNLTAALWWMNKAAAAGDAKALQLMNQSGMKTYQAGVREKLPPRTVAAPFGFTLGKPLPVDMPIHPEETLDRYGDAPQTVTRLYVEPPIPGPMKPAMGWQAHNTKTAYVAYATRLSGRIYRADGIFALPPSTRACRQTMEAFINELTGGRNARVLKQWETLSDDTGQVFHVMVDGPDRALFRRNRDLEVVATAAFGAIADAGKRHSSAIGVHAYCPDVEVFKKKKFLDDMNADNPAITFIHLPTIERRVAESFQVDPLLLATFGKKKAVSRETRPDYQDPFGIALGKHLEKGIGALGAESKDGWIAVTPPNPNDVFDRYRVEITPITKTVTEVTASNLFDSAPVKHGASDYVVCTDAMKNILKALSVKYAKKLPKWYWSERDRKTSMHSGLTFRDAGSGELRGHIGVECTASSEIDGFQDIHGRAPRPRLWRGTIRFVSDLGGHVNLSEKCAVNPETRDCSNDAAQHDVYADVLVVADD